MSNNNAKRGPRNTRAFASNNPIAASALSTSASRARIAKPEADRQASQRRIKQSRKRNAKPIVPNNAKLEMTPESLNRHAIAAQYLRACGDTRIRGVVPGWTANPAQSPFAVPFFTESTFRDTVGAGVTVTYGFPASYTEDYIPASMDGVSYHSNFINVGGGIYTTGPCLTYDGGGVQRVPIAAWRHAAAGLEVFPANTTGCSPIGWDQNYPLVADLRATNTVHLRWALVGFEVDYYCDTVMGSRGGFFNSFEPVNRTLPLTDTAITITGTPVRELPTYKTSPADTRTHNAKLHGRVMSRAYWHNDGPNSALPTASTNSKSMGYYLQFVNDAAVTQSIGFTVRATWAIAGYSSDLLGKPTPDIGCTSPGVQATLTSMNKGTVKPAEAHTNFISNVAGNVARATLKSAIAAASGAAGLTAFSPANLVKVMADTF